MRPRTEATSKCSTTCRYAVHQQYVMHQEWAVIRRLRARPMRACELV